MDDTTEQVYQFIWNYLLEHQETPTARQIGYALRLSHDVTMRCVNALRDDGRLRGYYPTAYGAYWREHVRENSPMPQIEPLPKPKYNTL